MKKELFSFYLLIRSKQGDSYTCLKELSEKHLWFRIHHQKPLQHRNYDFLSLFQKMESSG